MVTKWSTTRRVTLLLAAAAWLLALGHAPVMAIHVLSEHMCSDDAQSVSDEHDGHDDDHGHSTLRALLCRRPSPTFSSGASLALPAMPAPASGFTAEYFCVVVREVSRAPLRLHLVRSPVLLI